MAGPLATVFLSEVITPTFSWDEKYSQLCVNFSGGLLPPLPGPPLLGAFHKEGPVFSTQPRQLFVFKVQTSGGCTQRCQLAFCGHEILLFYTHK